MRIKQKQEITGWKARKYVLQYIDTFKTVNKIETRRCGDGTYMDMDMETDTQTHTHTLLGIT